MASKKISKAIGGTAKTRRTAGALPRLKAADRRSPLAVLRAARELLSVKERWTNEFVARNRSGAPVAAEAEAAVCWCSVGALYKVTPDIDAIIKACLLLEDGLGMPMADYNDAPRRTHKQILSLFDRAIARASKTEV